MSLPPVGSLPRSPPFVVVGNPASRRVAHFASALVESGRAEPCVVAWIGLAREGPRALDHLPDEPLRVRVDSFGEDFEVERAFLRRGYDGARRLARPATLEPAEVRPCASSRGA